MSKNDANSGRRSVLEDVLPPGVPPSRDAHVVRHHVDQLAHPSFPESLRERLVSRLAAESRVELPVVGHVVAVGLRDARLEDRGEVAVGDPQLGQVGHEVAGVEERQVRSELETVGGAGDPGHHTALRGARSRSRARLRASRGYWSPARNARSPGAQSRVSRTSSHRTRARWAGKHEVERLVVGVEQQQERVVPDGLPLLVHLLDRVSREPEPEAPGRAVRPLLVGHLLPVGSKPRQVLDLRTRDAATLEEASPVEHGMAETETYQAPRELDLGLGGARQRPVDPRELVVLAVGVVVSLLGPPDLVAPEQHRHALGQEESGEEVAEHPLPER